LISRQLLKLVQESDFRSEYRIPIHEINLKKQVAKPEFGEPGTIEELQRRMKMAAVAWRFEEPQPFNE